MRIIAAGGGGADDSRLLDEMFASWLGQNSRLLYLPVAMDGIDRSYHQCLDWLETVFEPYGITNITMCTELDQCLKRDIGLYHGIYIGGGNTYRLLSLMRSAGFDQAILRFAMAGGAVYGGSAGAIILGREIGTSAHLDLNQVGLKDHQGLNLLKGYAIWCHYQPSDDELIRNYMERFGFPVLALSESSGIFRQGDQLYACGFKEVRIFHSEMLQIARPGEGIPDPQ